MLRCSGSPGVAGGNDGRDGDVKVSGCLGRLASAAARAVGVELPVPVGRLLADLVETVFLGLVGQRLRFGLFENAIIDHAPCCGGLR